MNPIVYDEPSYEENALEDKEVFPACALTTAMRMQLGEEVTLLQDGSTETRDAKLKRILFAHVNYHFLYGDDDMSRFSTDTERNHSHLLKK